MTATFRTISLVAIMIVATIQWVISAMVMVFLFFMLPRADYASPAFCAPIAAPCVFEYVYTLASLTTNIIIGLLIAAATMIRSASLLNQRAALASLLIIQVAVNGTTLLSNSIPEHLRINWLSLVGLLLAAAVGVHYFFGADATASPGNVGG